jgi:ABC-type nitrate/sulfonate/bicarbonate transport system substrate-binding protein
VVDQNPDLAARFVRASLRGWQYALEHPDEAAEIIARWNTENSIEFQQMSLRAIIPLVDTGQVPIGWIDADRWQKGIGAAYTEEQPGYTMQFVEAAQE